MKPGDFVVPLPAEREWYEREHPWERIYVYIADMNPFIGQVGRIVRVSSTGPDSYPGYFVVQFPGMNRTRYYYPGWLRMATEEEARISRFLFQVKG